MSNLQETQRKENCITPKILVKNKLNILYIIQQHKDESLYIVQPQAVATIYRSFMFYTKLEAQLLTSSDTTNSTSQETKRAIPRSAEMNLLSKTVAS